jgi:hypothetical protein
LDQARKYRLPAPTGEGDDHDASIKNSIVRAHCARSNTSQRRPSMNDFRHLPLALMLLAIPLLATGGQPSYAGQGLQSASQSRNDPSPLIDKVRGATARFKDINVAISEGFVRGTPCVSGPDWGAMGVHFVLPARIGGGVLSADQPEALIYEPLPGGGLRLVGVEFIVLASGWDSQHPGAPPALEGHLLNFVGAPNRYGLPAFYELHVWAWQQNPVGSFADWNTHVSCDKQPGD